MSAVLAPGNAGWCMECGEAVVDRWDHAPSCTSHPENRQALAYCHHWDSGRLCTLRLDHRGRHLDTVNGGDGW